VTQIYCDGTYLTRNPTWGEEDSKWKAAQVLKILDRHGIHPSTIAEVGCGAGGVVQELARRFGDSMIVGYDISPDAIALANPKTAPNLEFRLQDICGTDEKYDLILALDVMEHVEDYLSFLRTLRNRAQWKVFHIPLDMNVQAVARVSPIRYSRTQFGHLHYFSSYTAFETLTYAGYQIRYWFYTHGCVELPGSSRLNRIMRVPRRLALRVNENLAVRFLGGSSLMVLCE